MRSLLFFAITFLMIISLIGCGESTGSSTKEESLYYSPPQGELTNDEQQIIWKAGNITFIAEKSKATGEDAAESKTIISSMTIDEDGNQYDITIDKKPSTVSSISLSSSNRYLAVDVFYSNVGDTLVIVNLDNGEQTILNKSLEINAGNGVETIHAYNWSPEGDKLAFSFGDTSISKLGIYDLEKKTILSIPTKSNLINTAYVMWTTNGDNIGFISEYPSDQFKLYVYNLKSEQVNEGKEITREDILKFSEFVPNLISQ